MKTIVTTLAFALSTTLLPLHASARETSGQEAGMQKTIQEIRQCMAKIDQSELEKLNRDTDRMALEIQTLCKQKKHDAAQKKALQHSREILSNPTMKQVNTCLKISEAEQLTVVEQLNNGETNICDSHQ